MDITELKVGSYISVAKGKNKGIYFKILPEEDIETIYSFPENYSPIPLNQQWVLEFGFFFDYDSNTYKISDCTLQLDDYQNDEGFMCIVFGEELRLIKYVHQLQFIYLALTGKELNIK